MCQHFNAQSDGTPKPKVKLAGSDHDCPLYCVDAGLLWKALFLHFRKLLELNEGNGCEAE
jgi:hypothetical protein